MKQRKGVRLAGLLCIASANVFSLISFAIAWFAVINSRPQDAEGFEVVNTANADVNLILHPITDISLDKTQYTFSDFRIDDQIALPQYDKYEIDASEYKCALLLEFHFIEGTFFGDFTALVNVISDGEWTTNANNYLSNAVCFSLANIEGNVATVTANSWESFVDMNLDSDNNPISFNSKTDTISLGTVLVTEEDSSFYVLMTYNLESVFYLCENSSAEVITYHDDLVYRLIGE